MGVRLEKQDSIGHIVRDRPPANTYDQAFMEELDGAIDEARRDDGVKAILVRSALERFCSAGADVSVFAKSDMDAQNAFVVCANEAIAKLESAPKVVLAAIGGHCLGGGLEIALCCDFRVAAEGSYKIGLPEVTLGLLPGTGGTQRPPRLIARRRSSRSWRPTTRPPRGSSTPRPSAYASSRMRSSRSCSTRTGLPCASRRCATTRRFRTPRLVGRFRTSKTRSRASVRRESASSASHGTRRTSAAPGRHRMPRRSRGSRTRTAICFRSPS